MRLMARSTHLPSKNSLAHQRKLNATALVVLILLAIGLGTYIILRTFASGWASLSGTTYDAPAATTWPGNGRVDVLLRGTNNAIWDRYYQGGSWSGWYSLGGAFNSAPAAASPSSSQLFVFGRGTDNAIWNRYWNGSSWTGWGSLGAPAGKTFISAPAATSWGPGRVDIFAVATDHEVWHRYWTSSGGWAGWGSLAGATNSAPAVSSRGANELDLFVRGTDNAVWQRTWNGFGWSGWSSIAGTTTDAPATAAGPGFTDVFVRGTDNAVWQRSFNGGWSRWVSIAGLTPSAPAATTVGSGVGVYVRGTDNSVWGSLVGPIVSSPAPAPAPAPARAPAPAPAEPAEAPVPAETPGPDFTENPGGGPADSSPGDLNFGPVDTGTGFDGLIPSDNLDNLISQDGSLVPSLDSQDATSVDSPDFVASAVDDSFPPSQPQNFTAEPQNGAISLNWDASDDNTGVDHYVLERSTDSANWDVVDDSINGQNYVDTSVDFTNSYYYRLSAFDAAGNQSDYATFEVKSNQFSANVAHGSASTVKSSDGLLTAAFASSTFGDDATCSLDKTAAPSGSKDIKVGPYQITCKAIDNSALPKFDSPVELTLKAPDGIKIKSIKIVAVVGGKTQPISGVTYNSKDNTATFKVQNAALVAGLQNSGVPPWLVGVLLGFIVIIVITVLLIRRRGSTYTSAYPDFGNPGSILAPGANPTAQGYPSAPAADGSASAPLDVSGAYSIDQGVQSSVGQQSEPAVGTPLERAEHRLDQLTAQDQTGIPDETRQPPTS
jgi:hypothetical protein